MMNNTKNTRFFKLLYRITKKVALVALFYSLLVFILLAINYFRLNQDVPLSSPALESLVERLKAEPGDEALIKEIQALQLLTRKAYFITREQTSFGGYLLLGGVILFLFSISVMGLSIKRVPLPPQLDEPEKKFLQRRRVVRLSVALGGCFILLISGGLFIAGSGSLVEDGESLFAGTEILPSVSGEIASYTEDERKIIERNWPNFRGPWGQGRASTEANPPIEWDGESGQNILWKTEIPLHGFNSPVVWEERIFLSGANAQKREVYCLNKETGKILWTAEVSGIVGSPPEVPETQEDTGLAAPSLAVDGVYMFGLFATGDLVCYDFSGQLVWGKNLGVPENLYGHASSLIIYKNNLIVQYDQEEDSAVIAFDPVTGLEKWRTPRDVSTSWSSPILIEREGNFEAVLTANPYVAAYNPNDGTLSWEVDLLMGEVGPSAAFSQGLVFAVNQSAVMAAVNPENQEIVWEMYEDLSNVSSPLATDKYVYMAAGYGVVTCYEIASGDVVWIREFDEGFYSSPIIAGGRVFLTDLNGLTHIIEEKSEFSLAASCELGEPVVSTPAFSGNMIFIRGREHLFGIGRSDG